MEGLRVNPKHEELLYRRIADELTASIEGGTYEPGERLPSIRTLAHRFGASTNTIREAYALLERQRLVTARPQSGYFVLTTPAQAPARGIDLNSIVPREVAVTDLTPMVVRDAHEPDWINLSLAEPPPSMLPTRQLAQFAARVARERPDRCVGSDEPSGNYALRQNIAKRAFEAGVRVCADEVSITSGCLEAVFLALLATCKPGNAVAIESPGFHLFYQLLAQLQLRVLEIPARARSGIDLGALEFALRHHSVSACVVIPNFHNPLGSVMPDENKRTLAGLAARYGVPIIEDDIYGELFYGPRRPLSLVHFDRAGLVIHCSSFSKTLAPGYRIGWTIAGPFTERIRRLKTITSHGTSSLSAQVLAAYLESTSLDRYLRRARASYRTISERVVTTVLESFPAGTHVTPPSGGFVVWVELPDRFDSVALYHRAREHKISFMPGPLYSMEGAFGNCLRLNASSWSPEIEHGIRLLGRLASEQI